MGSTLQSKGHPTLEQQYLRDLLSANDAHYSPIFQEDWSVYISRIEFYERRWLRNLELYVPFVGGSLAESILVSLFGL